MKYNKEEDIFKLVMLSSVRFETKKANRNVKNRTNFFLKTKRLSVFKKKNFLK